MVIADVARRDFPFRESQNNGSEIGSLVSNRQKGEDDFIYI